jgi:hypothetical protein
VEPFADIQPLKLYNILDEKSRMTANGALYLATVLFLSPSSYPPEFVLLFLFVNRPVAFCTHIHSTRESSLSVQIADYSYRNVQLTCAWRNSVRSSGFEVITEVICVPDTFKAPLLFLSFLACKYVDCNIDLIKVVPFQWR